MWLWVYGYSSMRHCFQLIWSISCWQAEEKVRWKWAQNGNSRPRMELSDHGQSKSLESHKWKISITGFPSIQSPFPLAIMIFAHNSLRTYLENNNNRNGKQGCVPQKTSSGCPVRVKLWSQGSVVIPVARSAWELSHGFHCYTGRLSPLSFGICEQLYRGLDPRPDGYTTFLIIY